MILLIDDVRDLPADRVCRTYDEGMAALKEQVWDLLLLDHDLGDPDERKTGYGIMCWLEQNPQHQPKEVRFVSSNPVGLKNMRLAYLNFKNPL